MAMAEMDAEQTARKLFIITMVFLGLVLALIVVLLKA